MADELRRYLAGDPIVARPISWLERRWRWCLNHRAAAGQAAEPFQSVDFHPSGQWIAIGGWGGGVEVWDLKKRQLLARPRETGNIWRVSFSEDGKKLGAAGEGGVWLWNLVAEQKVDSAEASLKVQEVANLEMPGVYFYCTFAPKTNEFTWCSHCVTQYDEISHLPREVPQAKVAPEVSPLGFLPNGTHVLLVSSEGNLQLHDIKADRVIRDVLRSDPPDLRVSGVNVSRSGEWAAVKWKRVGLSLINIDQPKINFDLPNSPTNSGVWFWQWSPDGKCLALACADGKIYVWNIAKVSEQLSSIGL